MLAKCFTFVSALKPDWRHLNAYMNMIKVNATINPKVLPPNWFAIWSSIHSHDSMPECNEFTYQHHHHMYRYSQINVKRLGKGKTSSHSTFYTS